MSYEIREIEETTYLVDLFAEQILYNSLDTIEGLLQSYPKTLKKYGYPVNKDNLMGVVTKGIKYFEDLEAKKIEEFAKNSPLARASIERMKAERIAEVISSDFIDSIDYTYNEISETLSSAGLGGLSEGDFIYKEKEILIDRRNIARRKIGLYAKELTDSTLEMVDRIVKLQDDILALEDKGLILFNTNYGVKGLLQHLGEKANYTLMVRGDQIDKGELANLILRHIDGRTRGERLLYIPGKEHSDYTKPEPQIMAPIPSAFGSYTMDEGKGYGSATIDKD